MKKSLLVLGMVAFLCGSILANTNPEESKSTITIDPLEQGRFLLNLKTEAPGAVKIKITNERGNTLMTKRISYYKSFEMPVDLSSLKEGVYRIEVESEDEHLNQEVFLSHMYKEDVAAFVTEVDDYIYDLRVFHEDVPVKIRIEDLKGNRLHEETIKSTHNFEKRLNLSQLKGQSVNLIIQGKKSYIVKSL